MSRLLLCLLLLAGQLKAEDVYFNKKSLRFHCVTCTSALACTKNCVLMSRERAEKFGVPCKNCGGRCR